VAEPGVRIKLVIGIASRGASAAWNCTRKQPADDQSESSELTALSLVRLIELQPSAIIV